jgi:hypothetical protein
VVKHGEGVTMLKRANTLGSSLRIGNDMPSVVGLLLLTCRMISQFVTAATNQHLHCLAPIVSGRMLTLSAVF